MARAFLTRLLYPAEIRDRYGAEITELLDRSATPVRDLADVAWCAAVERIGGTLRVVAPVALAGSSRPGSGHDAAGPVPGPAAWGASASPWGPCPRRPSP
ncbi:hypothetical protein R8Z50_21255 [Longispora sp. K20-0274]|uniref:hypothetical protein n=1 Tax=Longispora sp. K20-0274 TaxID=3088255 RepID=UPI00399A89C7